LKPTFPANPSASLTPPASGTVRVNGTTADTLWTGTDAPPTQIAALNQDGTVNSRLQPAEVFFSGPAPGLPLGVQHINLRLPAGLPSGDAVINLAAAEEATVAVC